MAASFLQSIFVPIVTWILPILTFSFLFLYIESDNIG
ncbi:photosystem I reaction center subunit VIII [Aetokthonos hydrillicola Thurmond2011]|uniref:Photosystem I reaction center subunit VIII n=1 Tax=Aetokthonos hydrillicola Thurmond2011 TaxID=2712845 RepID=A0AAP5MBT6_9CYAN|nr:photosystem I reaction center subunit VIII [Aetokthonos hydrillicola]MBO3460813.1 photosystem I reaction center subunit VIII [Aetokthonos hydrillicola CCALA 1050]MBW4588276.1 photosystem I reaction center subunit VIII [Aetokthonos hydrillicola CCALA 1050]MDR9897244.1 photosystem I reaction center subunit VIII [Aetokthonos hydrillicola Thurmond2011]